MSKDEDKKPKVPPKPRKEGETGGGGNINQTENRGKSTDRGGNPYKGGAGKEEKPKKKK